MLGLGISFLIWSPIFGFWSALISLPFMGVGFWYGPYGPGGESL